MQKIGSWVLLAALAVGTVYFFWFWPGRAALAAFSPVRSGGQTNCTYSSDIRPS